MDEPSDSQLLQEFATESSDSAFEALVQRYVNLVYSTALRSVGEAQMAKDGTQAVFIILARKASTLGPSVILPAWLYRTTRSAAKDAKKAERRRMARELEATIMAELTSGNDPFWEQLAPHLGEAMERLSEKDRAAIVLRFFEGKSLQGVGEALGTSDDSAQKRVTRALEKIRCLLLRRGVSLSAAILAGALMTQAAQAAPAGLAATLACAALKGTVAGASILTIVKGTLNMMLWDKLKGISAWGAAFLLAAGAMPLTVHIMAADNFEPVQVHLGLLSTGAARLVNDDHQGRLMRYFPKKIVLAADKPASLRRVPDGLAAPLYGQLTFGPREQPTTFTFLVDEPAGKPERLWVDRNGNGDLTDDAPVEWTLGRNGAGPLIYRGEATLLIESDGKPLEFGLLLMRNEKDFLEYSSDYARTGYVTLNGKTFRAVLEDRSDGDFRSDMDIPGSGDHVYLHLDLNGDGKFVSRGESFNVVKPFNIGGMSCEVTEMSPLGEAFKIVKSRQKVAEDPII
jgi:RNA polymerase sigma factor (sigma-70 family)